MEQKEFLKEAKKIIECCDTMYFSTYNKDYDSGETRAMANMRSEEHKPDIVEFLDTEDDLSNFIVSSLSSEKMEQIKDSKHSSLYFYCPKTQSSITLFGTTEIVTDNKLKEKIWKAEWAHYFKKGVEDPDYTVLKFSPVVAKYYTPKLEKMVVHLDN
ncbi:MAG: pyridoxamine 5'-phosphate oxidase family protein [Candidatus Gastranaerophilales bacterium]|nr:pyridoxamine 5'-phosphate oxidase family protein [Candidatus Gastranaerophilales bacterium]